MYSEGTGMTAHAEGYCYPSGISIGFAPTGQDSKVSEDPWRGKWGLESAAPEMELS